MRLWKLSSTRQRNICSPNLKGQLRVIRTNKCKRKVSAKGQFCTTFGNLERFYYRSHSPSLDSPTFMCLSKFVFLVRHRHISFGVEHRNTNKRNSIRFFVVIRNYDVMSAIPSYLMRLTQR